MLLGGDERGRTQRGNNNAYCQANEISFYDWSRGPAADALTAFTSHAIGVLQAHATLRRTSFFDGGGDPPDIAWFDARGQPMTGAGWSDPSNHFIAYLLAGDQADEPDDDVLVVVNATSQRGAVRRAGRRRPALHAAARHRPRRRPAAGRHGLRPGRDDRGRAADRARGGGARPCAARRLPARRAAQAARP